MTISQWFVAYFSILSIVYLNQFEGCLVSAASIRAVHNHYQQQRQQDISYQRRRLEEAMNLWDSQLVHSYEYTYNRADQINSEQSDWKRVQVIEGTITQVFHTRTLTTDRNVDSVLTIPEVFESIQLALDLQAREPEQQEPNLQLSVSYHPTLGYPRDFVISGTRDMQITIEEVWIVSQVDKAGNATGTTEYTEEGRWMNGDDHMLEEAVEKWESHGFTWYSFTYQRLTSTEQPPALEVTVNNKYVSNIRSTRDDSPAPFLANESVGSVEQIFELVWVLNDMQNHFSVFVDYNKDFGYPSRIEVAGANGDDDQSLVIMIDNFQDLTRNVTDELSTFELLQATQPAGASGTQFVHGSAATWTGSEGATNTE